MKLRWRFGIVAGLFLAMFSLYPQARLVYMRGADFNGHFAYSDVDEAAYAAYINALIDGRPRKNDPYTGRDDSPEDERPESLFSIQFASPYVIALPARLLGVNADLAMLLAGSIAAFFTGLALFWVAGMITGHSLFGMAAALAVICFGTLAAGEGAVNQIFFNQYAYPFLPGFRRYLPALPLPVFFLMIGAVWKLVTSQQDAKRRFSGWPWLVVAAFSFVFLVFSYFYVWTAAAAFLLCIPAVWLALRPSGWKSGAARVAGLGAICAAALLPYVWLLSQRDKSMDSFQLAVNDRSPDLFRFPEVVAFSALVLLIGAVISSRGAAAREPGVLFTLALAVSVFVVFNQQVVTGTSLQPIHYQVFVGNYVAALAILLAGRIFVDSLAALSVRFWRAVSVSVAVLAILWGAVECEYNVSVLDVANLQMDIFMPAARRLRDAPMSEPELKDATVLAYDLTMADKIPGVAPVNVLWAKHQSVFGGLSQKESERRFFCYLYYLNIDGRTLDRLLRRDPITIAALFGWDRHSDRLSTAARPLTEAEIWIAVSNYDTFKEKFSRSDAAKPRLTFVAVPDHTGIDLERLRKWYELGDAETVGGHTLYRVNLRDQAD